jgi:hypothetical protein
MFQLKFRLYFAYIFLIFIHSINILYPFIFYFNKPLIILFSLILSRTEKKKGAKVLFCYQLQDITFINIIRFINSANLTNN